MITIDERVCRKAIVDHRLSFTDQGKQTSIFRFRLLQPNAVFHKIPVLRIRIEKMRMRIQEKFSMLMRIRMRMHALTELMRAK